MSVWEKAQIEHIFTKSKPFGKSKTYPIYRFTPTDLNVIDEVLKYWKEYFKTFCGRVKSLHIVENRDVMLSVIKMEKVHMKLLENEYFRLKNIEPRECAELPDNQPESNKK